MANIGGLIPDHHGKATERKESLVNNELLSDVVFLVGKDKQKIFAHKSFLVVASDYFYVMFEGEFRESKAAEIPLEDIEWPTLKEILRHIYCGKADLINENIHEMFIHSKKFMLPVLVGQVSDFLVNTVTPENALNMLSNNRFYQFQAIDDKCFEFIGDDPFHYFSSEEFRRIDRDSLEALIKIRTINCSDEHLLDALQDWQKANPTENIGKLNDYIKLTARRYCCRRWQLFGELSKDPIHPSNLPNLIFKLERNHDVYLNGLGVFAMDGEIRLRIEKDDDDSVIVPDQTYKIEYSRKRVEIVDCFFPKFKMMPKTAYTIFVAGGAVHPVIHIKNPVINNFDFEVSLYCRLGRHPMNEPVTWNTCIACFYGNA